MSGIISLFKPDNRKLDDLTRHVQTLGYTINDMKKDIDYLQRENNRLKSELNQIRAFLKK